MNARSENEQVKQDGPFSSLPTEMLEYLMASIDDVKDLAAFASTHKQANDIAHSLKKEYSIKLEENSEQKKYMGTYAQLLPRIKKFKFEKEITPLKNKYNESDRDLRSLYTNCTCKAGTLFLGSTAAGAGSGFGLAALLTETGLGLTTESFMLNSSLFAIGGGVIGSLIGCGLILAVFSYAKYQTNEQMQKIINSYENGADDIEAARPSPKL